MQPSSRSRDARALRRSWFFVASTLSQCPVGSRAPTALSLYSRSCCVRCSSWIGAPIARAYRRTRSHRSSSSVWSSRGVARCTCSRGVLGFAVLVALSQRSCPSAFVVLHGVHSLAAPVVISRCHRALALLALLRCSSLFMAITLAVIVTHVRAVSKDLQPSPRARDARTLRRSSLLMAFTLSQGPL